MMHEYRLPSLGDPSRPNKTPKDKNIPADVSILLRAFSSSTKLQKKKYICVCCIFSYFLFRMHGPFAGYSKSLILWHKECYLAHGVLHQLQQQTQSCYLLCSPYKLPVLHWKPPLAQQIDSTANSSRILAVHRMVLHVKS